MGRSKKVLLELAIIVVLSGGGYFALHGMQTAKTSTTGNYTDDTTFASSGNKQSSSTSNTAQTTTATSTVKGKGSAKSISVLMYHNVYDAANPPKKKDSNCISDAKLEQQLAYLVKEDYYFPTWSEVRGFVDGTTTLPAKSVVLTFDDGAAGFIKYGAPLLEKYNVRATSFVIVKKNGTELVAKHYQHITLESHSYNMHHGGGTIGHGGIFTALSYKQGLADLEKSTSILGTHDAFAYPFGDYTARCVKAVKAAGFSVAFTTQYARIKKGDNPYLLPRVRINSDITMAGFEYLVRAA